MLCGPKAAARATGLELQTVIARIRWLREQRGRRTSLRGGTHSSELRAALDLEGFRMRRVFRNRRVRLAVLARRIRRGAWLFRQSGHFFAVSSAAHLRRLARQYPEAVIVDGFLIHPKRQT
jgi:hypothetical protein